MILKKESHTTLLRIIDNFLRYKYSIHTEGHTIQLYSFRWKPQIQSHHWLSSVIGSCLLINMKTMYKTPGDWISQWEKRGIKRESSNTKERNKGRNMIFFTSCEVRLWTEFGCFPPTQNTIIISRKIDISRDTCMCLIIIFKNSIKERCISFELL